MTFERHTSRGSVTSPDTSAYGPIKPGGATDGTSQV